MSAAAIMTEERRDSDIRQCRSARCGRPFLRTEGFDEVCPDCLTMADDHGAGRHGRPVPECPECW
jgi:hypothetical protein